MKIGVAITGASGRMGQEVKTLVENDSGLKVAGMMGLNGGEGIVSSMAELNSQEVDVVIDFSLPGLFEELITWCSENKIPLVSGTTGLSGKDHKLMKGAEIPILWAPNMSLGVTVLTQILHNFKAISEDFDFQIEEFHHRMKKDKPSGTGAWLQEELVSVVGEKVPEVLSIRGGGIFGVHKVWAMSEDETICVEHTALNRAVFARGALISSKWLLSQEAGVYSIKDVLGFS